MHITKLLIQMKRWPKDIVYLKSPNSSVVHLAFKGRLEGEIRIAQPMCGVWCWINIEPVLSEQIGRKERVCKNCKRYLDDFWLDKAARREDYLTIHKCERRE